MASPVLSPLGLSPAPLATTAPFRWRFQPFRTGPQFDSHSDTDRSREISPDKDMNFRYTAAAFTLSPAPGGLRHLVLTRPGTEPSMRFLSVGSHLCARASSRQPLARLPLPSASSLSALSGIQVLLQGTFTPQVHAHAGRTPGNEPDARHVLVLWKSPALRRALVIANIGL